MTPHYLFLISKLYVVKDTNESPVLLFLNYYKISRVFNNPIECLFYLKAHTWQCNRTCLYEIVIV